MIPIETSYSLDLGAQLPRYSEIAAQFERLLHNRGMQHVWERIAAASGVGDAIVALIGREEVSSAHDLYRLDCVSDSGACVFAVLTSDIVCETLARQRPDDPLHEMSLDVALGNVAQAISQSVLPGFRGRALQSLSVEAARDVTWCAVRIGSQEIARFALLEAAPKVLDALIKVREPRPGTRALRQALSASVIAVIAHRVMPLALLRSLSRGDVVLLDGLTSMSEAFAVRLQVFGVGVILSALATVDVDCIELKEEFSVMESAVLEPQTDGESVQHPPDSRIEALDVPVRFEIETVSIPLAELEAIQPGYIVELGMPVAAARLRLVALGSLIGEADLVAVGARLGARITRMVHTDGADNLAQ